MKALFLTQTPHEQTLPAMDVLQYLDANGNLTGGWWVVGEASQPHTVIICVDTTDEQIDIMAADAQYLFVGDVVEVQIG